MLVRTRLEMRCQDRAELTSQILVPAAADCELGNITRKFVLA